MTNNDIFDRIRGALKLTDAKVLECLNLVGCTLSPEAETSLGLQGQAEAQTPLPDALLADFLDGLIIARRGPSPSNSGGHNDVVELTNNMILKKVRIALNLYADDMLKLFHLGGKTLSKGELTVLFRKPTNKHYKPCGDELLSAFLEGVNKSDEHPR